MAKHGHSSGPTGKTGTYCSWQNMIARCTQPSNPAYEHYQEMGITVCERWRDFRNFLADMGERPPGKRLFTIERSDNRKDYEPGNCVWATWRTQGNNRSTNVRFEYRGQVLTLSELVRTTGVSKDILRSRLSRGKGGPWTVEEAVHTPSMKGHRTDRLGPMPRHCELPG